MAVEVLYTTWIRQIAMDGQPLNDEVAMNPLEHVQVVVEQHGLSVIEFFCLQVAQVFETSPKTATRFIHNLGQGYTKPACRAALKSCVAKGWLALSPKGMLGVTEIGANLIEKIASDLTFKKSLDIAS
jgi:hypothetical protein